MESTPEDNHDEEEGQVEKAPERPLECGECKKPIAVHYTEIIGKTITHTVMCADCPELQRRLHGNPVPDGELGAGGGLACGNCGTTYEAVKKGNPLGCSICYEVFDDILLTEMLAAERVPPRLATTKKGMPLHLGRAPGEAQEMSPSLRLLALNEALSETLKREDYEQAAWLRDQIKALQDHREKSEDGK